MTGWSDYYLLKRFIGSIESIKNDSTTIFILNWIFILLMPLLLNIRSTVVSDGEILNFLFNNRVMCETLTSTSYLCVVSFFSHTDACWDARDVTCPFTSIFNFFLPIQIIASWNQTKIIYRLDSCKNNRSLQL